MLTAFGALFAGLLVLVWSAHLFVNASSRLAVILGVPPLLIGMIIVGFGTSAPEMLVSAISAYEGSPGIALGNAYGSNIANIGLILGVSALIRPLTVSPAMTKREIPLLGAATLLTAVLLLDGAVTRFDAVLMLLAFAASMAVSIARCRTGEA